MPHLELQGRWWPPRAEHAVSGTLEFKTQDGGLLTTAGSLSDLILGEEKDKKGKLLLPSDLPDRIFGKTQSGELATLWAPLMSRHQDTTRGVRTEVDSEEYVTSMLYLGDHLQGKPEFSRFTFRFPKLHEWGGENVVREIGERDQLNEILEGDREVQTGYAVMEPEFWTSDIRGCEIRIFSGASVQRDGNSAELEENTTISLDIEDNYIFPDLRDEIIRPLRHFFTMALGVPVHPVDISATLPR